MRYFCYVHSPGSSAPYMEALDSPSLDQAFADARRLMTEHARSDLVELFAAEGRVAMIVLTDGGSSQPAIQSGV